MCIQGGLKAAASKFENHLAFTQENRKPENGYQLGPFRAQIPHDLVNPHCQASSALKVKREGGIWHLAESSPACSSQALSREGLRHPGGEQVYVNEAISVKELGK